jgi:hypothetical protein
VRATRRSIRIAADALVALMMLQALLGSLWPTAYRDPDWIEATWFGNDGVTLLLAVPLMWIAGRQAVSGSIRAELLRLGSVVGGRAPAPARGEGCGKTPGHAPNSWR